MDADVITSSANPRYRRIRSLIASSRDRHREGRTVLEGIHLVESWLERGPAQAEETPTGAPA